MRRYLAFDVETPNEKADSMCAIGLACLDEIKPGCFDITETTYTLVNPEDYFNPFNVSIHGILAEDVKYAPKFFEAWRETIKPLMTSNTVLVAHNAPFDMRVLGKSLRQIGNYSPVNKYICTVMMGKKTVPFAPNHKLNTLSELFKIELDHHNAGSDANACALLLKKYMELGADPEENIKLYDFEMCKTIKSQNHR